MSRIRTIKPEFWTDEKIIQLPYQTRLLFIGMWNFCDDYGFIEDSPERIRLQVLPSDRDLDIENELDLLNAAGLLETFINPDGDRLLKIANWDKHQRVDNPSKTRVPRDSYRKLAIPSESRRLLARKYGCPPGGSADAECYFCGHPGKIFWPITTQGKPSYWVSFSGLEIDHFTPESKGGDQSIENLVLSCRYCNRSRGTKDVDSFVCNDVPSESSRVLSSTIESSPLEGRGMEWNGMEWKGEERGNAHEHATTLPHPPMATTPPNATLRFAPPPIAGDKTSISKNHRVNGQHTTLNFPKFWEAYPEDWRDEEEEARKIWKKNGLDAVAEVICADLIRRQTEDYRWQPGERVILPRFYLEDRKWLNKIVKEKPKGKQNGQTRLLGSEIPFN